MKKLCFLVAIIFLIGIKGYSQKSPEKFGKNIEDDLLADICPIDSAAGAYVIFDFGVVNYNYTETSGFSWILTKHLRIKILDKSQLKKASFSIPIYNHNEKEGIYGFKAVSYNQKDGKIVESKINHKDVIIEKRSKYWNLYKFAVPNVEEGTVIEVYYNLKSPFAGQLRDWDFQKDIPVLHSEIWLRIPEYYTYHQNLKGYFPLTTSEILDESGSLNSSGENLPYRIETKHFIANNLPSLEKENYVDNIENYRSSIEFELSRVKFFLNITEYTTSWDAVVRRLLESYSFGKKINKIGYAKAKVEELAQKYPDKQELMYAIYSFVQNKIKWNNRVSFAQDKTLKEVYEKGSGRASDINFILLNMLKKAGFEAYPVALSTRNNGFILPSFPTMDGFNNMVVIVFLKSGNILLDASSSYCPPGVLPVRCLNGKGRIIDKNFNSWINLKPSLKYDEMTMYDLNIEEDGTFNGKIMSNNKGYASISFRNKMDEALSEEKMVENIEENHPGLDILSQEFKGLDKPYDPIVEEYDVSISETGDFMGDMMIFNPLMYEKHSTNPFKLEKREYPINYTYNRNYKYIFRYDLPEGYVVESLPEAINISLPDKGGKYIYTASQIGNILNLTVMLQINKDIYLPSEYSQLKQFYNLIIAKESEEIIIKKAAKP